MEMINGNKIIEIEGDEKLRAYDDDPFGERQEEFCN